MSAGERPGPGAGHGGRSLLLVAFHTYPDPAVGAKRVSELANHLVGEGWRITAITQAPAQADPSRVLDPRIERIGIPRTKPLALQVRDALRGARATTAAADAPRTTAPAGETAAPARPSITARLLAPIERHYHLAVGAIDDLKRWTAIAVRRALRMDGARTADVVLVSGPPWSTVVGAMLLSRRLHTPLVIDFRDPWYDRNLSADAYPFYLRAIDRWAERLCMRRASAVVVTSDAFAMRLRDRYPDLAVPIEMIRNGFDEGYRVTAPAPRGELHLLYAGTIYFNRNPMPLLRGLAALVARPGIDRARVRLRLVGYVDTWQGKPLQPIVEAEGIADIVEFMPPVSGARVQELTQACNVIVNFAQGQPEQVPAKLYEQLVANRHGLLFAEHDSESAKVAACVPSILRLDDDVAAVADALNHLYRVLVDGEPGPSPGDGDVEQHSRRHSNAQMSALLQRVALQRGAPGRATDREDRQP